MTENDYYHQRQVGAQEIMAMARQIAREAGLAELHCEWDHGRPIVERDSYTLKLASDNVSCQGTFSDEELADFSGKVGTQHTKSKITTMIKTLITENAS